MGSNTVELCYHHRVTEHPRYAIDDPSGYYRCIDCGNTFPLIGDTDKWEPKEIPPEYLPWKDQVC